MILLEPFRISELRDVILRTVIKAENAEDIAAVAVFRFYTVEEIEDKRNDNKRAKTRFAYQSDLLLRRLVSGNGDLSMSEKWQRWMVAELRILKNHYPNMPRDDLMQLLPGRTWRAIMGAAERYGFHRNRCDVPLSEAETVALHTRLNIARSNRIGQPFAGKHHSAEAKLHISVSNLHARGHSIAAIAKRNRIAKKEVKKIIEKRKKRRKR